MNISKNVIIHPNVVIGNNVTIEDFCIIGAPPRGVKEGELKTVIGNNALIRSHTVIYSGNIIGNNFQTGNKVNIRELNKIGDDVSIGTLSVIEHHIDIESGVRIHTQAFIPEYSILKERAWIGPNVVLTNVRYPLSADAKNSIEGPIVEKDSKIGANSTILPGVVIGEGSLIGAGSVVTKNVDPKSIVIGNPARKIKDMD